MQIKKTKKMRIAIYSDFFYPELSGITDTIITTSKELARRGHKINFFVPKYCEEDYKKVSCEGEINLHENITVTRFSSLHYPTGTGQGRMVIPNALRAHKLSKFNPDLIHAQVIAGVGIEALIDSKILRKPLVGTNHTPIVEFLKYVPLKGRFIKNFITKYDVWYYNQCKFVSSPCQQIFDEMEKLGFKAPHQVVPNPLDAHLFEPSKEKDKLKKELGFGKYSLLYTGRLAKEKNIDLGIIAVSKLKNKIPDITYVIAGRGSEEENLRNMAKELGVEKNVIFFGYIKNEKEYARIYQASDVFLMMSTAETQSIAAMKALACGSPVLAANAWGLKDYINNENGFLIKPGDIDELTEKIEILYNNSELREKLGAGGVRFAEKLSISNVGDIWENIYSKVLEK